MPFSTRCMRPNDWAEIKHFTAKEFKQPLLMGYEFLKWLDAVREAADVPMLVSSSYRSDKYNDMVGGASNSAHEDIPCSSVDIRRNPKALLGWNHARMQIVSAAIRLGCRRVGIYQDDSIHLDMTHDTRPAPRLWIKV